MIGLCVGGRCEMDVPVRKRQSLQTTEWWSVCISVQEVGTGYVTAYETGHHHRMG